MVEVIKVISDLHIGVKGTKENDFKLDEDKFKDYLLSLVDKCSMIVLLGDVFDLLQSEKFNDQETRLREIIKDRMGLYGALVSMIVRGDIVYVNGNHDAFMRTNKVFSKIVPKLVHKTPHHILVFDHGHRADIFNGMFSNFISWIVGWLERIGFVDIDKDAPKLLKAMETNKNIDSVYIKYAKKLQERYTADMVVLGHTHNAMVKEVGDLTYVNSGKGCDRKNKFDETTIIVKGQNIEVKQEIITL